MKSVRGTVACSRGGAYLAALLTLSVLSAIGLTLVGVTTTEFRIGANERSVQRAFYAAGAGLDAALARALGQGDYGAAQLSLNGPDSPVGVDLHYLVESGPFYPIHESSCDLCRVDAAGSYSEPRFHRYRFVVTATAQHPAGPGVRHLARKTVTTLLDVEPWTVPAAAYLPLAEPAQLAGVRF